LIEHRRGHGEHDLVLGPQGRQGSAIDSLARRVLVGIKSMEQDGPAPRRGDRREAAALGDRTTSRTVSLCRATTTGILRTSGHEDHANVARWYRDSCPR
jgi:hypothetical protein